jgi:DNA polymerase-3 subunit alpha
MLAAEFSTVGFYISGHPLSKYAGKLSELGAIDLAAVEGRRNGEEITVAGIVIAMRPMRSRKGERWGILTLQDMTGVLEVLAFPESFARLEPLFKSNDPVLLKGRVNVEEAGTRLAVMDAKRLEDIGQRPPNLMRVRVDMGAVDGRILDELKHLFAGKPGSCAVAFDLISSEGAVATLRADQRVRADQDLVREVCRLCGENAVQLESRA